MTIIIDSNNHFLEITLIIVIIIFIFSDIFIL